MSLSNREHAFMSALGERVVTLRKQKGIKQFELAIDMNIPDSGLRLIEKGKTNPTTKTLLRISDALDISIEDLLRDLPY